VTTRPGTRLRKRSWGKVLSVLVALAMLKVGNADALSQRPVLTSDFLVRCQEQFQYCEDRVVDIAISLIMTSYPKFCDPKKDDPTALTRLVLDWMSSHPGQSGETATEGIASALANVRPCADEAWLRKH
jgi:hypothetical protein